MDIVAIVALGLQTLALVFYGGRSYQILKQLQKTTQDHEERLRIVEEHVQVLSGMLSKPAKEG